MEYRTTDQAIEVTGVSDISWTAYEWLLKHYGDKATGTITVTDWRITLRQRHPNGRAGCEHDLRRALEWAKDGRFSDL